MPDEHADTPAATEAERNLRNLLAKKDGDALALAADLLADNAKLRDRNRDLKAKVLPDGAQFITEEEAQELETYRALGKSSELLSRLEAGETAATELTAKRRQDALREAAEIAGYKPAVLQHLLKDLEVGVSEVEVDGKQARVPHVQVDGKAVPLSEYATSNWADFLPSLQASAAAETQKSTPVPLLTGPGRSDPQRTVTVTELQREKARDPEYQA